MLMKASSFILFSIALLAPRTAAANGTVSHIHISELAIRALAPGELRDLMMRPENVRALRAGSMFPDSGYSVSDEYGEIAHWSPFLRTYVQDLRRRYDDTYTSADAEGEVAFLLGVASHGLADQTYDTTLLARALELDGPEPASRPVDQYADYFLIVDHDARMGVEAIAPYPVLPPIFAAGADHRVTVETLMMGVERMRGVVDFQIAIADTLYFDAWESYPWLGTHVYNHDAVGSLPWTAEVVADYWEVIWRRLHGAADLETDLLIRTHPEDGSVNWPVSSAERGALGKVGLFFGHGVRRSQVAPLITMQAREGEGLPIRLETAYGGEERNLIFVVPEGELAYDTEYQVTLHPGVETLDGDRIEVRSSFSFRTRCADSALADCPPLPPSLVTGPMPPRPEPPTRDGSLDDAGPTPTGEGVAGCGCAVYAEPAAGRASTLVAVFGFLLWLRRRRTQMTPSIARPHKTTPR